MYARQNNQDARSLSQQIQQDVQKAVEDAQRAAEDAASSRARVIEQQNGPNGSRMVVDLGNGQRIVVNGDNVQVLGRNHTGVPFTPDLRNAVPNGAVDIVQALAAMVVLSVVGWPLSRAIARWMDRRGSAPKIPSEVMTRLQNIEQAVDTVAVEVERISEGQRFTSKLLADRQSVPVGTPR